jgi:hypothetical protein
VEAKHEVAVAELADFHVKQKEKAFADEEARRPEERPGDERDGA